MIVDFVKSRVNGIYAPPSVTKPHLQDLQDAELLIHGPYGTSEVHLPMGTFVMLCNTGTNLLASTPGLILPLHQEEPKHSVDSQNAIPPTLDTPQAAFRDQHTIWNVGGWLVDGVHLGPWSSVLVHTVDQTTFIREVSLGLRANGIQTPVSASTVMECMSMLVGKPMLAFGKTHPNYRKSGFKRLQMMPLTLPMTPGTQRHPHANNIILYTLKDSDNSDALPQYVALGVTLGPVLFNSPVGSPTRLCVHAEGDGFNDLISPWVLLTTFAPKNPFTAKAVEAGTQPGCNAWDHVFRWTDFQRRQTLPPAGLKSKLQMNAVTQVWVQDPINVYSKVLGLRQQGRLNAFLAEEAFKGEAFDMRLVLLLELMVTHQNVGAAAGLLNVLRGVAWTPEVSLPEWPCFRSGLFNGVEGGPS